MKRFLPLWACAICLTSALSAQVFQDNFDAYAENAYIAQTSPAWFTWSANGAGTAEDARVSKEQAFSGEQSLKLFSTSTGGGPMDIVLPFGQVYNSGTFTYGMKMYVVGGTGAYFNLQANATIGQVWAMDVYFRQTGIAEITTGATNQGSGAFPHDTWFDVECVLDLTNNDWQIFVNGEKIAGFSNVNNQVASINLYPVNPQGTATYYVDDVFYDHVPFVQPQLDLSLFSATTKPKNIAGNSQPIEVTLRNLGLETIESVDVNWTDGTNTYTDEFTNLNLISNQNYTFTHSTPLIAGVGLQTFDMYLSNINGAGDDNDNNNVRVLSVTGVIPAAHKKVVAEEGTGTWCGWCPRGTVMMDFLAHDYGDYFVPIAVHNNDPMTVTNYNAGLTAFPGFTGFPGVIMERTSVIDPLGMEDGLFNYIPNIPAATLLNGAAYDELNGELKISVSTDMLIDITGNWRINVVITEDGVTGSGSAYNQANYYSGGSQGPMGGYEFLPDPVPASMMVYDHVARAILGGWAGQTGSVPTPINTGEGFVREFTWNVPANVNIENIHIVSMLLLPSGRISNVNSFTFQEALANGLASSNHAPTSLESLQIYPNPASVQATVNISLSDPKEVRLEVMDLLGRTVHQQQYGVLYGEHWLNLSTYMLENGIYTLRIHSGEGFTTQKLAIQH